MKHEKQKVAKQAVLCCFNAAGIESCASSFSARSIGGSVQPSSICAWSWITWQKYGFTTPILWSPRRNHSRERWLSRRPLVDANSHGQRLFVEAIEGKESTYREAGCIDSINHSNKAKYNSGDSWKENSGSTVATAMRWKQTVCNYRKRRLLYTTAARIP